MRMTFLVGGVVSFLCAANLHSQSGWVKQNSRTSANLTAVAFVDTNTGTVVGDGGVILRTTNGGAAWIRQESGTTSALLAVSLIDSNIGTAVGDGGTILRTNDGGEHWVKQESDTTRSLYGVAFLNADSGVVVGSGGAIFGTTNGGVTWEIRSGGPYVPPRELWSVALSRSGWGLAVGGQWLWGMDPPSSWSMQTTDGGVTWREGRAGCYNCLLYGASTSDPHTGTFVGSGHTIPADSRAYDYSVINWTSDRGTTWSRPSPIDPGPPLYAVSCADTSNQTAVGASGTIIRTTDGGVTWISQSSGTSATLTGIAMIDANTATAVGSGGIILRTTNGGQAAPPPPTLDTPQNTTTEVSTITTLRWSPASGSASYRIQASLDSLFSSPAIDRSGYPLTEFHLHNLPNGTRYYWRVGSTNIYGSGDFSPAWSFRTESHSPPPPEWVQQNSGTLSSLYGVSFADARRGIAVGFQVTLRTTDGGVTWENQATGGSFTAVSYPDSNIAIIAGTSGFRRTTDGGLTWTSVYSGTGAGLFGVSFVDRDTGIAVGDRGTILRTTDGGKTWAGVYSPTSTLLYGVAMFAHGKTGIAVGYQGTILRTSSGGRVWTTGTSGTGNWLLAVSLSGEYTATAVGSNGIILSTTDAGATWTGQSSGTTSWLRGVSYSDSNTGYAMGMGGTILRTTDRGSTWIRDSTGTETMVGVSRIGQGGSAGAVAVGYDGLILQTAGNTVLSVKQLSPPTLARQFSLSQNYPNPFNGVTIIRYSLPSASRITLKLYNILGEELRTILDGHEEAGEKATVLDLSKLSTGLYLVRMIAGSHNEIRKILLIR